MPDRGLPLLGSRSRSPRRSRRQGRKSSGSQQSKGNASSSSPFWLSPREAFQRAEHPVPRAVTPFDRKAKTRTSDDLPYVPPAARFDGPHGMRRLRRRRRRPRRSARPAEPSDRQRRRDQPREQRRPEDRRMVLELASLEPLGADGGPLRRLVR